MYAIYTITGIQTRTKVPMSGKDYIGFNCSAARNSFSFCRCAVKPLSSTHSLHFSDLVINRRRIRAAKGVRIHSHSNGIMMLIVLPGWSGGAMVLRKTCAWSSY